MTLRDRWNLTVAIVREWGVHARAVYDWSNDGCSSVPDFNFRRCCELHDFAYRNGVVSRWTADWTLAKCIWQHGWPMVAFIYWAGVRLFGRRAYRWDKRRQWLIDNGHG